MADRNEDEIADNQNEPIEETNEADGSAENQNESTEEKNEENTFAPSPDEPIEEKPDYGEVCAGRRGGR